MNDTLKYLLNNGKKTLLVLDQDGTITESRWNEKLHSRNIIDDWDRTGEHYMDMPVIPQTMELVKYAAERGIQCGVLTASNEVEMKGKLYAMQSLTPENVWLFHISSVLI